MSEVEAGTGAQPQSFTERKAAQLNAERVQAESREREERPEPERTSEETPAEESGSVQDDGYPELHDEEGQTDQVTEEDSDLTEETPEYDDEAGDDEPRIDWEKRCKDTQSELTRVNERREQLDNEVAESMATAVRLKHDLEDRLTQAERQAGFFQQNLHTQIGQLEQAFNSGQIPPDQLPQARQQYQALQMQKNQLEQYVERAKTELSEAEQIRKQREAEVSRTILARVIPDWSREKYGELRNYASRMGFSTDEFDEVTDHRMLRLLNDSMLLHSTKGTVENVRQKRKPKPPRSGRNVDRQPRDGRGKFKKLEREFHSNPNQKGRFAAMTEERLKREKRGR